MSKNFMNFVLAHYEKKEHSGTKKDRNIDNLEYEELSVKIPYTILY